MICAADNGVMAIRTIPDITKLSHAIKGMRVSFIPGHRRQTTVAMMLIAVPMLPNPETKSASVQ